MAVAEGDLLVWVARLREASEVLHREVRWLGSDVSGPFSMVVRMATSDVWGGPFAEQLRGTIRSFDRQLVPWLEHLGRFQWALEEAAQGAELAARAEASGVAAPFDVLGVLARWRVWPSPPWPLDPGWATPGGRPSTFVWVYPERARQLAVGRVLDPAGRETCFEHDRAGRITAMVDCLGGRFEYRYDRRGDLVGVTDACGGNWAYRYDEAHRLAGITDPEGRAVVANTYDGAGRVVEQRDGAGSRWAYLYGPGRTVVTDPLGHKTSYEHDARFRTVVVTNPVGAVTRLTWDGDDRLEWSTPPGGG